MRAFANFVLPLCLVVSSISFAKVKNVQTLENQCTDLGDTPDELGESLIRFIIKNDADNARRAISCGADVNYTDGVYSVLMWASNMDIDFYQELLDNPKLDIHYRGTGGNTALHLTLLNGNDVDKSERLIRAGANVFAINDDGANTLVFAVRSASIENVNLVIDANPGCFPPGGPGEFCDQFIRFRDMNGKNALDYAAKLESNEILALLKSLVIH